MTSQINMLKETLKKDEIAAMKARDKARVSVLRLVNSEIKAYEVNNREEISDENVIKIIEKSIKQKKRLKKQLRKLERAMSPYIILTEAMAPIIILT